MDGPPADPEAASQLPETIMEVDPHAPFDPTPSSSSHAPPPNQAGSSKRRQVFSNADFYSSHFEAHVASVAAHFRGEPADEGGHLATRASAFPSRHFWWSQEDKNLFFASLSRRGKSWPDLIAADMAGRKSPLEVMAYLARLDGALVALPEERRKLLRVPPPPAREVSDRWVAFEEDMASDYLDLTRKRERDEELSAREAERDRALKRVHRTLPPAPWTLPGAGPKTHKQTYRRGKQSKEAKQRLQKDFAREDWLELLDKDKAAALSKEMKHPSRLSDVQPGSDDEPESATQPLAAPGTAGVAHPSASSSTPPPLVSIEGDPPAESAGATARKRPRVSWYNGKLRRELVVMGLGDLVREKELDVFSFRIAHQMLSRNPSEGSEPMQVPLSILDTAKSLLRVHVSQILRHVLALKLSKHDSESDSAADLKPTTRARLITRKNVYQALANIQGAEGDQWFDEVDALPDPSDLSSTLPSEPHTSSLRAMSPAQQPSDSDDDQPQSMTSVDDDPTQTVGRESTDDDVRLLGRATIYRPAQPVCDPRPVGVVLMPAEPTEAAAATFYQGIPHDVVIGASDDEGGQADKEEDQAEARLDQQDLAADHAWEDGLWATIANMDHDGLAWLTLGNLIDVENADLAAVHVISDSDDSDDDGSDVDMNAEVDSVVRSSQYSATPPPPSKTERDA